MEYRGVEFRIVARPGPNEWRRELQRDSGRRSGNVTGPRDFAIQAARICIDRRLAGNGNSASAERGSGGRLAPAGIVLDEKLEGGG